MKGQRERYAGAQRANATDRVRHQKIDMLLIEDVGSGQRVCLFVGQLYQHGTLDSLGWPGAATAQTGYSVVTGANSFLVPLEKGAAENGGPDRNVILGSSALGFPYKSPVINRPDLDFDVLQSVSFNFNLRPR